MKRNFDRTQHVYRSDLFSEIVKDTIRFFNGTPVIDMPPPEPFSGAGVYALYCIGRSPLYEPLYNLNRMSFAMPIYVGKAVPHGWRQARSRQANSNALFSRPNDHCRSINQAKNLNLDDFKCRFMILEDAAADMISTAEAFLIREYKPLWNSTVDGFGNHAPGKGRIGQAKSDRDVLHPGREWAENCKGASNTIEEVESKVKEYFNQ